MPHDLETLLYNLLDRAKRERILCIKDLSEKEVWIAEELVKRKLLSKHVTLVNTFYTYGVNHEGRY